MMEFKGRQHSGPSRLPKCYGVVYRNGSVRVDDENNPDFWMEITFTAEEIAQLQSRDVQDDTADGN